MERADEQNKDLFLKEHAHTCKHTHWYCTHYTQRAVSTAVSALDEPVFRTQLPCFTFLSLPFSCLLIILHLSLSHTHALSMLFVHFPNEDISDLFSYSGFSASNAAQTEERSVRV